ncbi:hypothetical protein Syun_031778 [Stephania yunnanensis]|uniref:Uncharacterized protein n=1 Tax=Stephania yunnanensis TaxID=152371 RepID=A0AAP0DYX9_9MAGN
MAEAVARDRVEIQQCTWEKKWTCFQLERDFTYLYGRVDIQEQIRVIVTSGPTAIHRNLKEVSEGQVNRTRVSIGVVAGRNRAMTSSHKDLVWNEMCFIRTPLISLIRHILGTTMPHPMIESACVVATRDPNPVAPAFYGLRLLGLLFILFPLTLILVILLDFTYLCSSISCLTECRSTVQQEEDSIAR